MTDPAPTLDAPAPAASGPRAVRLVALWLSVVALVLALALVIPFLAPRNPLYIPVFALAFAAAIVGLVLAVRAGRARGASLSAWALVAAGLALVVDVILLAIFLSVLAFRPALAHVELRGQGPDDMSATFWNGLEERTLQWPSEGHASFSTADSWAEISITAPEDAADPTVRCQIVWNGEVVVDETAASGEVTCRYDEG